MRNQERCGTLRDVPPIVAILVTIAGLAACGVDANDAAGRTRDGILVMESEPDGPSIEVVHTPPSSTPESPEMAEDEHSDHGPADAAAGSGEAASHHEDEHDESVMSDADSLDGEESDGAHDPMDHSEEQAPAVESTSPADEPGSPDQAGAPDADTVVVEMHEFGYALSSATVPVGRPVTFQFANLGDIEHEAMFGSMHEQEEFAGSGDHGDHGTDSHHGEVAAITLDAGATGEMTMVFETAGEVMIGCHLPGHWDAGMSATFEVVTV